nr:MAG: hypothetical protein [Porcellio scaber clopovirus]
MELQKNTKVEDLSYSEKPGWANGFFFARALKICINQNNIPDTKENVPHSDHAISDDSHYYAVTVKRPEKIEELVVEGMKWPRPEKKLLEEYLSSVHFLIAIDLKHSQGHYYCIENDLKTFFTNENLLPLYQKNIHYYTNNYEGEDKRREFLEFIERDSESYGHDDNGLKKDQRIVLNYFTDYYEDRGESFNNANIENLKKATVHSNFIFIKDLQNESWDEKMEERGEGGGGGEEEDKEKEEKEEEEEKEEKEKEEEEEEEVEKTVADFQQEEMEIAVEVPSLSDEHGDSDEKSTIAAATETAAGATTTTAAFQIPSPNRNIPSMLKTFIEYRKCFANKCLNHPSLYALQNKFGISYFLMGFLKRSKNYYNASLPEKLSTNVSGYRLAEDGSFSKEVKEFNYNDFILFKKQDFENLKITLRDAMGNAKAETGLFTILPTHEHFAPTSLKMRKEDYMRLNEFVLDMNKQWIGEMYLIDKGYESGIIKKSVDFIFNVYSTFYKNFENETFKGCAEKEKRAINSSSSEVTKMWENPAFRKERASELLYSSIEKTYFTDLILINRLTNLMGS